MILGMHEINIHRHLPKISFGATKLSLSLPILTVMLGLLLLNQTPRDSDTGLSEHAGRALAR
jgi:hypothetical protein